jgi:hypothetical protein
MKNKALILVMFLLVSASAFSQQFALGDRLNPTTTKFKLLGISSATGVSTYKYIGAITDTYLHKRKVGEIIVGLKNGVIVTTIYNLIPEAGDVGVPKSIVNLVQRDLPYPLAFVDGMYGVIIDNVSTSLSRTNNPLTFHKDRIMYMKSVKTAF